MTDIQGVFQKVGYVKYQPGGGVSFVMVGKSGTGKTFHLTRDDLQNIVSGGTIALNHTRVGVDGTVVSERAGTARNTTSGKSIEIHLRGSDQVSYAAWVGIDAVRIHRSGCATIVGRIPQGVQV